MSTQYDTVTIVERVDGMVAIWHHTKRDHWIMIPNDEWRKIVLDWADHFAKMDPAKTDPSMPKRVEQVRKEK